MLSWGVLLDASCGCAARVDVRPHQPVLPPLFGLDGASLTQRVGIGGLPRRVVMQQREGCVSMRFIGSPSRSEPLTAGQARQWHPSASVFGGEDFGGRRQLAVGSRQ